jgi:hypothetical protein
MSSLLFVDGPVTSDVRDPSIAIRDPPAAKGTGQVAPCLLEKVADPLDQVAQPPVGLVDVADDADDDERGDASPARPAAGCACRGPGWGGAGEGSPRPAPHRWQNRAPGALAAPHPGQMRCDVMRFFGGQWSAGKPYPSRALTVRSQRASDDSGCVAALLRAVSAPRRRKRHRTLERSQQLDSRQESRLFQKLRLTTRRQPVRPGNLDQNGIYPAPKPSTPPPTLATIPYPSSTNARYNPLSLFLSLSPRYSRQVRSAHSAFSGPRTGSRFADPRAVEGGATHVESYLLSRPTLTCPVAGRPGHPQA